MTPQDAATQLVDALSTFDGVAPEDIRTITLTPTGIILETYELDANGGKYLVDGHIALATRKLPYRYAA